MAEAPGVLVTRPEPDAAALAGRLAARGWRPVLCPLLEFAALPAEVDAEGVAALIFTSANGVRAAPADPALRRLPVWAVGEATAEAARAAGFGPVRAGPSDAAALAAEIARAEGASGRLFLHLRGRHASGGLADALAAAGLRLREVEVYEMRAARRLSPAAEDALGARRIVAVPVWSPRTAKVFAALAGGRYDLSGAVAVAISDAAAAPLGGLGFRSVRTVANPDRREMLAALEALRTELAA